MITKLVALPAPASREGAHRIEAGAPGRMRDGVVAAVLAATILLAFAIWVEVVTVDMAAIHWL